MPARPTLPNSYCRPAMEVQRTCLRTRTLTDGVTSSPVSALETLTSDIDPWGLFNMRGGAFDWALNLRVGPQADAALRMLMRSGVHSQGIPDSNCQHRLGLGNPRLGLSRGDRPSIGVLAGASAGSLAGSELPSSPNFVSILDKVSYHYLIWLALFERFFATKVSTRGVF